MVLMFGVDAVDLFPCPTLWPVTTHLEDVTSLVACFTSIYKTISVRAREQWCDSCSSSCCGHLSLDRGRHRQGGMEGIGSVCRNLMNSHSL